MVKCVNKKCQVGNLVSFELDSILNLSSNMILILV